MMTIIKLCMALVGGLAWSFGALLLLTTMLDSCTGEASAHEKDVRIDTNDRTVGGFDWPPHAEMDLNERFIERDVHIEVEIKGKWQRTAPCRKRKAVDYILMKEVDKMLLEDPTDEILLDTKETLMKSASRGPC